MNEKSQNGMNRRQLLEAAGSAAAAAAAGLVSGPEAAAAPPSEAEIIDDRLTRKVTLAVKAMALSDLCDYLRAETGVPITAGPSVADEKVTLFCEKRPLREVMRQLARPFGYTWLRSNRASGVGGRVSGTEGSTPTPHTLPPTPSADYRYELVQDLRSQLLEEELRNRDRNVALLALEREIERYRPYLDLSPDEARERAKTAPPEEKRLLEQLGDLGWGPIQMYFRLSNNDLAAIRAGQWLIFSQEPQPGERPLPADLARGVLQSLRGERVIRLENGFGNTTDLTDPRGVPWTAVPEAGAQVKLSIVPSELGQFTLEGFTGRFVRNGETRQCNGFTSHGPLATGRSRSSLPRTSSKPSTAPPGCRSSPTTTPGSMPPRRCRSATSRSSRRSTSFRMRCTCAGTMRRNGCSSAAPASMTTGSRKCRTACCGAGSPRGRRTRGSCALAAIADSSGGRAPG